jgi:2-dehydropantoate 2-reductase
LGIREIIEMKIAIMGAGGLGSYIGGRMVQAGHDVTFIARGDHLQALQDNGLEVKSEFGNFELEGIHAVDNPNEIGIVDLALFCVKAYDVLEGARLIKPIVSKETVIIPVLNGIDHVNVMGDELGQDPVLGGLPMIVAHLQKPGFIEQVGQLHFIEFGEVRGGNSKRCADLEKILSETGIEFRAIPNIMERMCWKLCIVSGFVGVYSVVRANNAVISRSPETVDLLREAILEAVTVAQANGIQISTEFVDEILAGRENASPEYKPSMLVDIEKGKRIELEAIIGVIVRLGKTLGVSTPVNNFIYACLKPYENGNPSLLLDRSLVKNKLPPNIYENAAPDSGCAAVIKGD